MNKFFILLLGVLSFNLSITYAQAPDYRNNPSFAIHGDNPTPVSNPTPIVLITAIPTPTGTPFAQAYYVTDFTATNSDGSIPTDVQLLDDLEVKYQCGATANSRPCTKRFKTPIKWSVNRPIIAKSLTDSADVRFSVQGYRAPEYTRTATPTYTPTATPVVTNTPTATPTPTRTPTPTPTPTATPTPSEPPNPNILNFTGLETGDFGESYGSDGSITISTNDPHSGVYSFEVNSIGGDAGSLSFGAVSQYGSPYSDGFDIASLLSGFMFRAPSIQAEGDTTIYTVLDNFGTKKAELRINADGSVSVYDVGAALVCTTASTVLSDTNWHLLELWTNNGAGVSYDLSIDGVSECSGPMDQGDNNAFFGVLGTINPASGVIDFYFDDAYWAQGDGGTTDYLGEQNVVRAIPDANGSPAGWTAGTGPSNYTQVFETPTDLATTYVQAVIAGNVVNMVNLESSATAGITRPINSVKCWSVHTDLLATTVQTLATRMNSGGTIVTTTPEGFGGVIWVWRYILANNDPNTGSAWGLSGIDALQCGVVTSAAVAGPAESTAAALVMFDTPP